MTEKKRQNYRPSDEQLRCEHEWFVWQEIRRCLKCDLRQRMLDFRPVKPTWMPRKDAVARGLETLSTLD